MKLREPAKYQIGGPSGPQWENQRKQKEKKRYQYFELTRTIAKGFVGRQERRATSIVKIGQHRPLLRSARRVLETWGHLLFVVWLVCVLYILTYVGWYANEQGDLVIYKWTARFVVPQNSVNDHQPTLRIKNSNDSDTDKNNIRTNHLISARRPGIIIINKKKTIKKQTSKLSTLLSPLTTE